MKAKYWLISGISAIALAIVFEASYQSFLSNNTSAESFDFSTAQNYQFWISTLGALGLIALIIGAIWIAFQKSSGDRWQRWHRLAAAAFLFSVVWAIVGVFVQTLTGDVLFWLGYQKPSNMGYSQLEQLFQVNDWKEADELTSRMIRAASATSATSSRRFEPTLASFSRLPCADFQAIDRLWLKHSSDRFGFSVQRQIYESITVSESDFSSPLAARMETFLRQVKRNGNSDPKFSREDAIGSLPSSGIWISTPYSSMQLFATEESMKRQKWCGF